ncbi:hypothetical protein PMIN04_002806 [Paraphaeosphaeria minitans]
MAKVQGCSAQCYIIRALIRGLLTSLVHAQGGKWGVKDDLIWGRRKARRWHWEQQRRKAEGAMLALGATTAEGGRRDAGTGSNNGGRRKARRWHWEQQRRKAEGGRRDAGSGSNNGGRRKARCWHWEQQRRTAEHASL